MTDQIIRYRPSIWHVLTRVQFKPSRDYAEHWLALADPLFGINRTTKDNKGLFYNTTFIAIKISGECQAHLSQCELYIRESGLSLRDH